MFRHRKIASPSLSSAAKGKVLLLIDWDNLFFCLFDMFKTNMQLEHRLKKLIEWVQKDIGELFGGHGFLFAPEHLAFYHQEVCVQNNLKIIVCPKRTLEKEKLNPKTGKLMKEEDTVDETIIWFGRLMMRHPDVKFICLVSGDDDFVPFFEEAGSCNIKRVLAPPTINSLSRSKRLIRLADKHPDTLKKMILMLDAL